MPEISVIMGVYNGERYVGEAIESILSQSYDDFEFIIVDDCSTDRTNEIIKSYNDPRIKIIRLERNHGLAYALNIAAKESKGKYIARMDSDDISLNERFERQILFFSKNQDVSVLGTSYYEIDSSGEIIGEKKFPSDDKDIKSVMIKINPFFHASIMMKKESLEESGFYNGSLRMLEDYDLWIRMSKKCKLANMDESLIKRRYHEGNVCLTTDNAQLLAGVKLRLKYIFGGYFPAYTLIHVIKPLVAYLTPQQLRKFVRKTFFKSSLYGR